MTECRCPCSTFGPGPHDPEARHPNPKACEHAEYPDTFGLQGGPWSPPTLRQEAVVFLFGALLIFVAVASVVWAAAQ